MEAEVGAAGIDFNPNSFLKKLESTLQQNRTAAAQVPRTRGGSTPDNILNVQTPLGGYDRNGKPDYLEAVLADVPDGLMNRVQNVLMPGADNFQYAKPAELVNVKLTQNASL